MVYRFPQVVGHDADFFDYVLVGGAVEFIQESCVVLIVQDRFVNPIVFVEG